MMISQTPRLVTSCSCNMPLLVQLRQRCQKLSTNMNHIEKFPVLEAKVNVQDLTFLENQKAMALLSEELQAKLKINYQGNQ